MSPSQSVVLLISLFTSAALSSLDKDFVNYAGSSGISDLSSLEKRESPQNSTITQLSIQTDFSEPDCYPWMYRDNLTGTCKCSEIPYRAVLCDPTIPRTSILDCYCMTYNTERNETELGRCMYGCGHKTDTVYYKLPQNKSDLTNYMCGRANRDSTLCGECKPGYSPLVYSYELKCMNCTGMTYNWIKYIAVAYVPLTFFFFFVIIFRFSGTSPLVRGFISICQGLASPIGMRAYLSVGLKRSYTVQSIRVLGSIYGIWNLDFFRTLLPPICLDITPLQALALDYAIAFYPLVLIIITLTLIILHGRDVRIVVWLWKPFHKVFHKMKQDWDFEGSIVKAFATFFLLSYLKTLNATADLLIFTERYTLPLGEKSYQVKRTLYYDASVEYFADQHRNYGIAAIFVGLFFAILPLVFLFIYPMCWFQKCLNYFRIQRQSIDMFVNCYQGYYKDGTNGTRDYRCFSISFFFLQLIVLTLFMLSRSIFSFSLATLAIIPFVFIILLVQPYKEQFKAIDAFMLFLLVVVFIVITAADEADIKAANFSTATYAFLAIVSLLPLFYVVGLSIWWIFVKKKIKCKLPCFRGMKSNSVQLQESYENNDFPDRIENPSTYEPQAAPLLNHQEHDSNYDTKYGSVANKK